MPPTAELPIDFTREAKDYFRSASDQTRYDAAPVLAFLSHGFQISWFRESHPRVWIALVKPRPSVQAQFALTLEYVVIGHGFSKDFHQRTLLEEPPEEIEYRIDRRIRFVASAASLMKASCAAWAMQRRIAVVALDANEIDPDATDNAERLYTILSKSLWRRDVFDDSDPITNPTEFFGRELAVQEIVTRTLLGKSTGTFGLRKIGKTSLLRRVQSLLEADPMNLYLVAFLQGNATEYKTGRWWQLILDLMVQWGHSIEKRARGVGSQVSASPRKLRSILNIPGTTPDDAAVATAFQKDFEKYVRAARQLARDHSLESMRLVVVLDEADELYPTTPEAGFWKQDYFSLWNTIQTTKRGLEDPAELVFIVGGVNPRGAEAGSLLGRPNPLFEMGHSFLGPLPEKESAELLRGLGQRIGLHFTRDACSTAHALTGGHPWLLRKLGSKVHLERLERSAQLELSDTDVQKTYERVKREFYAHVDWVLSHLQTVAPDEYRLLRDVAIGGESSFMEDWRDHRFRDAFAAHLAKYGLISFDDDVPRIRIGLVTEVLSLPSADSFAEQKQILREAVDELEQSVRRRLARDLAFDRTLDDAVNLIATSIPADAKNRSLDRSELIKLGKTAGLQSMLEALNWGDYTHLLTQQYNLIRWTGPAVAEGSRLAQIRRVFEFLHVVRHNNDTELQARIARDGFDRLYADVRTVREMFAS